MAEIARTEAKKEERVMQERSLRGTVSVERGMAMKRVVRDCLSGVKGVDEDEEIEEEGGGMVECGVEDVVGVEGLEWVCEEVDGVGRGEERVD